MEKIKKQYPVINISSNGIPNWYEGAYTLAFVYSKFKGNFILKGYRGEVKKYLEEHYSHYFVYYSMWSDGKSRGHWIFWKNSVTIFEPSKIYKTKKYRFSKYINNTDCFSSNPEKIILEFKRIPKRWIKEFDKF
jgi:hypothetical protein